MWIETKENNLINLANANRIYVDNLAPNKVIFVEFPNSCHYGLYEGSDEACTAKMWHIREAMDKEAGGIPVGVLHL